MTARNSNSNAASLQVSCSRIEVRKTRMAAAKECHPPTLALQNKILYAANKWRIKIAKQELVKFEPTEQQLQLETESGLSITVHQVFDPSPRQQSQWELLGSKIQDLYQKYYHGKQQFQGFLQSTSSPNKKKQKTNSGGSSGRTAWGAGASSNSSLHGRQRPAGTRAGGARTGKFGTQAQRYSPRKVVPASLPWDDNFGNVQDDDDKDEKHHPPKDDDEVDEEEDLALLPPETKRVSPMGPSPFDGQEEHDVMSSTATDEEEREQDDDKAVVGDGVAVQKHKTTTKQPLDDEEEGHVDDDDAEASSDKDEDFSNNKNRTKKKHHRISKLKHDSRRTPTTAAADGDSFGDGDDLLFDGNDLTTPAAQRVVSPGGTTTTKKSITSALTTTKKKKKKQPHEEKDDGDDDDIESTTTSSSELEFDDQKNTAVEKNQPVISSFFQKKKQPASFDPSNNVSSAVTTPPRTKNTTVAPSSGNNKTPTRRPTTPSSMTTPKRTPQRQKMNYTVQSEHAARMIRATPKKHSMSSGWIRSSPAGKLSPSKKRAEQLFGLGRTHKPAFPSTGHKRPRPEEEDPIEDSPESSPARHRRVFRRPLLSNHRRKDFGSAKGRLLQSDTTAHARRSWLNQRFQAQADSEKDEPPKQEFRGLSNLGNTCYQNASMQMLFTLRKFMLRLERSRLGGELTEKLCRISRELQKSDWTMAATARPVKDAMDEKTEKFLGFEQRDAHEFMSDLVDYVHEELEKDQGDNDDDDTHDQKKAPLPTDDFCLTVQVCLECTSCGYSRDKEEMYRHLSIDIVKEETASNGMADATPPAISKASVEKGLTRFFEPEIREIKCEKCDNGTHAKQSLRILSRPKVLLLHLKRFIVVERPITPPNAPGEENKPPNSPSRPPQVEYVFKKNKAPVQIPPSLLLEAFQAQPKEGATPMEDNDKQTYALKSIVHHIGSHASSGHYNADALRQRKVDKKQQQQDQKVIGEGKCQDDKDTVTEAGKNRNDKATGQAGEVEDVWVSFDDRMSVCTTLPKILNTHFKQTSAYMLLYALDGDDDEAMAETTTAPEGTHSVVTTN